MKSSLALAALINAVARRRADSAVVAGWGLHIDAGRSSGPRSWSTS
jgi:hypothetical protein